VGVHAPRSRQLCLTRAAMAAAGERANMGTTHPPLPVFLAAPASGTTTTAESMFMGVPVVSLRGDCHAQNVGCSLLQAVGLADEWAVDSGDTYVAAAVAAAADLPRLAALRASMRDRMLGSPLCNAARFLNGVERVYAELFDRWHTSGDSGKAGAQGAAAGSAALEPAGATTAEPTPLPSAATGSSSSDSGGEVEVGDRGGSSGRSSRACTSLSPLSSGCSGDDDIDDDGGGCRRGTHGAVDALHAAGAEEEGEQEGEKEEEQWLQEQRQRQQQRQRAAPSEHQQLPQRQEKQGVKRASGAE
jgi:hypothetical protein